MVIYVEGGGESKSLRSECRRGFSEFLRKAGLAGRMPRITACGSRKDTYDAFCTASSHPVSGETYILLVDSETPIKTTNPWNHLARKHGDNWPRPAGTTGDQCHLMVQCMETWFLADKKTLTAFFGQGCNDHALPRTIHIEKIAKATIYEALEQATKNCKTKNAYGKSEHSFRLLALIDPAKVRDASPWALRFLETVTRLA
ncbi:MAG: DUF4276 family protein [Chitinivibrionales bacterium]|nr:DUF4276 family protein [Chitinivibrionales bacterium]